MLAELQFEQINISREYQKLFTEKEVREVWLAVDERLFSSRSCGMPVRTEGAFAVEIGSKTTGFVVGYVFIGV
jgi:hypothetical protein